MNCTLCGPLGGGKGLFAMEILHGAWQSKRPIITNMHIREGAPFHKDVRYTESVEIWDLDQFPRGATIVFDEADLWFYSRNWNKMDEKAMEALKYSRKRDQTFVFIAQRCGNLWNLIRDLSQRHFWVDNSLRSNPFMQVMGQWVGKWVTTRLGRFWRVEYADPGYRTLLSQRWYPYDWVARKYFVDPPWFDTRQELHVDRGESSTKSRRSRG